MSDPFDPGHPVDYPARLTYSVIDAQAVERGAAALSEAFPTLNDDYTPCYSAGWFLKAARVVLEGAMRMQVGEPVDPPPYSAADAYANAEPQGPLAVDPWRMPPAPPLLAPFAAAEAQLTPMPAVTLEFTDGRPLIVNPAFVVSLYEAVEADRAYADGPYTGPMCALLLAWAPNGWLVRGTVNELTERLWG